MPDSVSYQFGVSMPPYWFLQTSQSSNDAIKRVFKTYNSLRYFPVKLDEIMTQAKLLLYKRAVELPLSCSIEGIISSSDWREYYTWSAASLKKVGSTYIDLRNDKSLYPCSVEELRRKGKAHKSYRVKIICFILSFRKTSWRYKNRKPKRIKRW